ncbi:nuclear transcription factor Y subunit gamma-like [Anopheles coustani]|uniref:nuclear transcription factor Y subunit gamma-like n=1 Tax=Anopheles coustani TaxID=139045 RepID=UPI002657F671|nr:nuclear transcription factor Y subunit gamma-like [Anopheles coustani]
MDWLIKKLAEDNTNLNVPNFALAKRRDTQNAMEKKSDTVVPKDVTNDTANRSGKKKLYESELNIQSFWPGVMSRMQEITHIDTSNQSLPLARIKKIMKLDEEVKMIGAEAPLIFAQAIEMFVQELTMRAFLVTESNKRRTLLRSDVAMAIATCEEYDFLIDIVPREEKRKSETKSVAAEDESEVRYYSQIAKAECQMPPHTTHLKSEPCIPDPKGAIILQVSTMPTDVKLESNEPQANSAQTTQKIIFPNSTGIGMSAVPGGTPPGYQTSTIGQLASTNQPVQHVIQHVLTPSGEIAQISIPQNQMNFFRATTGGTTAAAGAGATQPFFIQAAPTILTSAGMFLSANQLQQIQQQQQQQQQQQSQQQQP